MKISLLILTQNRWYDLRECLDSIKSVAPLIGEILVLDNGSDLEVTDSLRTDFPYVTFFRSEENLGVARGRNELAQMAKFDLLWFLDDDAQLGNLDYVSIILDYFQNEKVSLISFKVFNRFTLIEETRGIPHKKKRIFNEDKESAYFNGCSFVVHRSVFLTGLSFWNELYYSGEELALSYEILEKNLKIVSSVKLWVLHNYQENLSRQKNFIYFNARNRPWLAWRYLPWMSAVTHSLFWWGYLGFKALRLGELKCFFKGIWDSLEFLKTVVRDLRKPISDETLVRLKALGGRVWY